MSDGDGFQLLEHVAPASPSPVILLAARQAEEEARRAANMGAIGYLGKPISLQETHRLWKESEGPAPGDRAPVLIAGAGAADRPARG